MLTILSRLPAFRLPKMERVHMLGSLVLALTAGLYLLAGLSLTSLAGPDGRALAKAVPVNAQTLGQAPAPEPLKFKEVAPQDAVAINASVPIDSGPNPAARAFLLRASSLEDSARSLECLTAAIYYEAATESVDGQRAVAQVVLNRVRHPAYPASVCGVVFQGSERSTGCQFTFTCDGSLNRAPVSGIWARTRDIARAALAGYVYSPVGWATHYHTNWVVPYWSSSLVKVANVGTHIFYRWDGGWGRPGAFRDRHSGNEPVLPKMGYLGFGKPPAEQVALTPEERAALAAGALPPGEKAGETPAGEAAAVAPGAYDPGKLNRAIMRRFQPVKREDVAEVVAKQAKPGESVPDSYRWAMTGGSSGEALGRKATPSAPAAQPAAAGAH